METNANANNELQAYSLRDAAGIRSTPKDTLAILIKEGRVNAIKIGVQWKVSHTELQRLLVEGTGD